jgi:DNA-binding Lrp family transcriptional regulator
MCHQLVAVDHLSPAACLRRAKRLRDEGIILADVSIVAPEAVGRPLMMIVLVTLEHEQIEAPRCIFKGVGSYKVWLLR